MESYDYIVVGAGSAGCVVARRLSDQSAVRVLLLEAGPPADDFWIRTPAGMAKLFLSERYNWRYATEPVPQLRNRKIYWPRGKTLGGSSAINGMVYTRGNRRDYDHWAALGNDGWAWDDVLPFFKRAEDNERGASHYRGTGGPLRISDPAVMPQSVDAFIEASRQWGIPYVEDLSSAGEEGVGVLQATICNGVRQSAYDAFIAPVRHRENLTVRTGVHVRRVLFQGRNASGVEVLDRGEVREIRASREVVICAGALGSPHVLMLSGIGDGARLQQHGIKTHVHAPGVGQNLQDHFSVHIKAQTKPGSSYNFDLLGWRQYWQGLRYIATKNGFLALGSSLAAAFVKSTPEIEYADLEISFRPMTFTHSDSGSVRVDPYHAISASVYRVRPASRGEILLRSADPLQPPSFHPNYLQADEDRRAMLAGLRHARAILATEPLASRVVRETSPGTQAHTDEHLVGFMEQQGKCAYHPAGTCKMGRDAYAVVDARLRVRGVGRLRVIDASIMPTVTSGNTNAPTIMIGEKGADMILAESARVSPGVREAAT
ncbi:Glucose-methanol-choline oxidoreductase [Paraburkholderia sabiae]|uniref:GMC family oxidoreductase n=1 Tax=Paraburkholderia sabiae TaxID=273251 RepID=UPI001CB1E7D9|nr:GMC family oxidoreductase N-terminal domain-containing protein [Paraburkholderia sabiae]CAG9194620.1 Glucose-methanol-choline oxidoreductase [Paraburkholderia sabiae]